jgi:hypothetical protein
MLLPRPINSKYVGEGLLYLALRLRLNNTQQGENSFNPPMDIAGPLVHAPAVRKNASSYDILGIGVVH